MSKFSKMDKFVLTIVMPFGVYAQAFEFITQTGAHGIVPYGLISVLVGLCYLATTL
jgi:hypothetical protein